MRSRRLPQGLKKTKKRKMIKQILIIGLSLFVCFSQMSLAPLGKAYADSGSQISGATVALTDFKVDGQEMSTSGTNTNVNQDGSVELDYDWSIPDGTVKSGDYFTFSIPTQIDMPNGFTASVDYNGQSVGTLTVGTNNTATITFNSYLSDNKKTNNVHGTVEIDTLSFAQSVKTGTVVQPISFSNDKSYQLAFNTTQSDVTKVGVTDTHSANDFNASTITWTSDINTHADTVDNATVTDTLPAGVGTPTNIHIYPVSMDLDGSVNSVDTSHELQSGTDYSVSSVDSSTHQFTITFTNSITQAYKIVYDTAISQDQKVNLSSASSSVNPTLTNSIQLNGTVNGNDLNNAKNSASVTAHYAPFMTKSSNGSYNPKTQTITWTINYNFNNSEIQSPIIHDVVTGDSGYVDSSLTVKKVTPTGSSSYKNATSDTGTVDNVSSDRTSFDIKLNGGNPTSDAYVITYQTRAADPAHIVQGTVKNAVTNNGATVKSDKVNVYNVGITKSGKIDPTKDSINWTIDLNQLNKTLTDQSDHLKGPTLTDTFGSGIYGFDGNIVITNKKDNSVLDSSNYTVTSLDNGNSGFTVNFHEAINTIEYLLSYSTKYNPQSSYSNSYTLNYNDGTTDKEETVSDRDSPPVPTSSETNNGYKTGSYDALTKTFTWDEVVNFDSLKMEKAEVTDTMSQDPDNNGSHNIMVTDASGKPNVTVYQFNYTGASKGTPVSSDDYTVTPVKTASGITGFTLDFNNEITGPYVIEYQSQPTGVIYSSGYYKNDVTLQDLSNANVKTSFSNRVPVPHATDYTVKNGQMLGAPYDTVSWTVGINEAQSDLGTNVKLADTLSANQTYAHDSFKLYKAVVDSTAGNLTKGDLVPATDYSVSFSKNGDNGESFELDFPSNQEITGAYILTYNQNIVRNKGLTQIKNNAQIAGSGYTSTPYSYSADVRIASGSATGTGEELGYVSVGDYVWLDKNRDGIQDSDESGIPGVVLSIKRSDNSPILMPGGTSSSPVLPTEQTTDSSGHYEFANLPALPTGVHYIVSVDKTASADALKDWVPTKENSTSDTSMDSSTWTETSKDLTSDGDSDQTLDFGFMAPAVSVGDYVWKDTNRNGLQDDGNTGIRNVTVLLTGPDGHQVTDVEGNPVGSTSTDSNGYYEFDNLPVLPADQHYTVTVGTDQSTQNALRNLIPTTADTGNSKDNDSSTGSATSYKDLSQNGDQDLSLDFGYIDKAVSVGDYVWKDTNRNGIQDAGESGINGVQVKLTLVDNGVEYPVTDNNGQIVAPQTTSSHNGKNGYYDFTNLPALLPGQLYKVTIDQTASAQALNNLIPTTAHAGGSDATNDSSTGSEKSQSLSDDGDNDPTLDFGYIEKMVSVGDYVWLDQNRNGVQDAVEKGISNVTLTLTGPDGKSVTDVYGNTVEPVTTDSNGHYEFDHLPALPAGEHYTVSIDKQASSTTLTNLLPTKEDGTTDKGKDSSTWSAESEDLTNNGDEDNTLDFGFYQKSVSVGDYVWKDTNRNGIQDANEPGINGVQVELTMVDADGSHPVTDNKGQLVAAQTTTSHNGQDGYYDFINLPALLSGQLYKVTINQTASDQALQNLIPTTVHAGSDTSLDSSTGSEKSQSLSDDGDNDPTLDFGYIEKMVSVGDYVWLDQNRNGVQDVNEKGISNVTLTLAGSDGKSVTDVYENIVGPVTTDNNGHYEFDHLPALPAGEHYTVSIDKNASLSVLNNVIPTKENGTTDKSKDSSTWNAESGNLTNNGDEDNTLDFGFHTKVVSVGDYVWYDKNKNGIQDLREPGIEGVVLTLTGPDGKDVKDIDGNLVNSAITDKNGHYEFDHLPALPEGQHYTVSIDKNASQKSLANLVPTLENGTSDRSKDSSTWDAQSVNLVNDGDSDFTLDFGFRDNMIDITLQGKPGVVYNVVDNHGHIIRRGVMADEQGNVIVKGLKPGSYHLVRAVEAYVSSPSSKKNSGNLPTTGDTNDLVGMAAGLVLLLCGGGLAFFARRRGDN